MTDKIIPVPQCSKCGNDILSCLSHDNKRKLYEWRHKQVKTTIYLNGGDYAGEQDNNTLDFWKQAGLFMGQKYLYKGYQHFYNNTIDTVIVFDVKRWDAHEIAKRKANGFKGIREYILPEPKR